MAEFIKNSPFRFWCQKVLPLVYDDSLSYYELLCKVVHKLNELAENQNNLSEDVKQIAKDLEDFKNQVPGMIEQKIAEWLNNYITTKGLVNSVNGMKGDVTLKASDVGAIANTNGSVKNNNIAAGAVTTEKMADGSVTGEKIAGKSITANKLADGVIPEKLPNPHKLTFSGGATGEYDGSKDVNIAIPAGGGGAGSNAPLTFTGAVDATYDGTQAVTVDIPQGGGGGGGVESVNGETGAVVLKPLTAGEGLTMSGEGGYNGSAEQSLSIAPGGVTKDKIADRAVDTEKMANGAVTNEKIANGGVTAEKMASGVIPTRLPNPQKLTFTGAASGTYDGSAAKTVNIPAAPTKLPNPEKLTFVGGASATYDGSSAVNVSIPSGINYYSISKQVTNQLEITVVVYYNEDYYFACSVRVKNTATLGAGSSSDVIGSTPTHGPSGSTDEGACVMLRSDAFTPTYYAYVRIANNQVYVKLKRTEDIPAGEARGSIVFE